MKKRKKKSIGKRQTYNDIQNVYFEKNIQTFDHHNDINPYTYHQIRGGQNCLDTRTPPFADPNTYHDSTHCLRYSDIWYSIFKLSNPVFSKSIMLKVYEKRETEKGPIWVDLVNRKVINIGSTKNRYSDPNLNVLYYYPKDDMKFGIDQKEKRVLIPKQVIDSIDKKVIGNPEEFLVVDKRKIELNGSICDKVGVGFEAFYHQPNRCGYPAGKTIHSRSSLSRITIVHF